jgi:uncharacterized membrane protein YfcA
MFILAALLAIIMGLTLGLLGGGGSILTVPILVYILHVPEKTAIAMSLLVVGTTSLVAMGSHAKQGNVAWRTGAVFGLFGMLGAFLGGKLAALIPGSVLLTLFALLMFVTGAAMLRPKKSGDQEEAKTPPPELPVVKIAAEGVVVGAVTGLVGAGGGFLVVPALALMGGLPMKRAIGTSLLVIAMKSFAGFASFASFVTLDWALFGVFTGASVLGTIGGTLLARIINANKLRTGFAVFVFVMAAGMISKQLGAPAWLSATLAAATLAAVSLYIRQQSLKLAAA